MPYKVIDGDLLNTQAKYICHQVNCKGRMGSGVAKQIRAKYPEVYTAYVKEANADMLGIPQFVQCYDGKVIINMFAQQSYGYDGRQYTSYEAFAKLKNCVRSIQLSFGGCQNECLCAVSLLGHSR